MTNLVSGRIVRKLPKSKFDEPNSRVACKLFAVMVQTPGHDALVKSIQPFAAARHEVKTSLPLSVAGFRTFLCPVTVYFPGRYVK
jgi:hypothetical protein